MITKNKKATAFLGIALLALLLPVCGASQQEEHIDDGFPGPKHSSKNKNLRQNKLINQARNNKANNEKFITEMEGKREAPASNFKPLAVAQRTIEEQAEMVNCFISHLKNMDDKAALKMLENNKYMSSYINKKGEDPLRQSFKYLRPRVVKTQLDKIPPNYLAIQEKTHQGRTCGTWLKAKDEKFEYKKKLGNRSVQQYNNDAKECYDMLSQIGGQAAFEALDKKEEHALELMASEELKRLQRLEGDSLDALDRKLLKMVAKKWSLCWCYKGKKEMKKQAKELMKVWSEKVKWKNVSETPLLNQIQGILWHVEEVKVKMEKCNARRKEVVKKSNNENEKAQTWFGRPQSYRLEVYLQNLKTEKWRTAYWGMRKTYELEVVEVICKSRNVPEAVVQEIQRYLQVKVVVKRWKCLKVKVGQVEAVGWGKMMDKMEMK